MFGSNVPYRISYDQTHRSALRAHRSAVFLHACGVETIEVGSRVDEARENGCLPPKADLPLPNPEDGLEECSFTSSKPVNATRRRKRSTHRCGHSELPEPLRNTWSNFFTTVDLTHVQPEALPLHAVGYLAEKHHLLDQTGTMTENELIRIGLALAIDDPALIGEVLERPQTRQLLHCAIIPIILTLCSRPMRPQLSATSSSEAMPVYRSGFGDNRWTATCFTLSIIPLFVSRAALPIFTTACFARWGATWDVGWLGFFEDFTESACWTTSRYGRPAMRF